MPAVSRISGLSDVGVPGNAKPPTCKGVRVHTHKFIQTRNDILQGTNEIMLADQATAEKSMQKGSVKCQTMPQAVVPNFWACLLHTPKH